MIKRTLGAKGTILYYRLPVYDGTWKNIHTQEKEKKDGTMGETHLLHQEIRTRFYRVFSCSRGEEKEPGKGKPWKAKRQIMEESARAFDDRDTSVPYSYLGK